MEGVLPARLSRCKYVRTSPWGRGRCCLLGHARTPQQDQGTSAAALVMTRSLLTPPPSPMTKLSPRSDPYHTPAGLAGGFPAWFIALPVVVTLISICKVTSVINREPGCSSPRCHAWLSAARRVTSGRQLSTSGTSRMLPVPGLGARLPVPQDVDAQRLLLCRALGPWCWLTRGWQPAEGPEDQRALPDGDFQVTSFSQHACSPECP